MTGAFNNGVFGTWPPGMPVFEKLDTTLNLYLDPVGGNDAKVGTSRANAVRTPARIANLIALYPGNVDVHMRSGAAVLPDRGWFLLPRMLGGLIRFIADEAWDPAVFTVVGGNRTAEAATSDIVVKASGLVVNALQDLSMRFTTGDAAGQYRRVRNNTATDIIPTNAFIPAPAPGDTYQIFTSNARFALPDGGGADPVYDYLFCGDTPSWQPGSPYDASEVEAISMTRIPAGLLFDGVGLDGGTGAYRYLFGRVPVYFYGMTQGANFLSSQDAFAGNGTLAWSGYGLQEYTLKSGWGFAALECPTIVNGDVSGVFSVSRFRNLSKGTIFGGRIGALISAAGCEVDLLQDFSFQINPLLDNTFSGFVVRVNALAVVRAFNADIIGTGVQVNAGGFLQITDALSGPGPVFVSDGGKILAEGAVNLGGGGNDWTVFGVAAFNKSFFGAADTFKFGTDGSLAKRIS